MSFSNTNLAVIRQQQMRPLEFYGTTKTCMSVFKCLKLTFGPRVGLVGQCGHDASLFLGDVIELFVKELTGPTTYYEFEWSPNGDDFDAQFDTRFGPPGTAFESMMTSGVQGRWDRRQRQRPRSQLDGGGDDTT